MRGNLRWQDPGPALERARVMMWDTRARARVVHPEYGEVIVPHRSNLCAITIAAGIWGCEVGELMDAPVWLEPEGAEIGQVQKGGAPTG